MIDYGPRSSAPSTRRVPDPRGRPDGFGDRLNLLELVRRDRGLLGRLARLEAILERIRRQG